VGRGAVAEAAGGVIDRGDSVLLRGPAGIGKSTLLKTIIERRPHLVGHALDALSDVAYHPLSHAIRVSVRGSPADVAAEVSARLNGRILAIEDAHWADQQTLDVLRLLADRSPTVVTSRTELPGWPAHAATYDVPPMDTRSSRALARRLHPKLTDSARQRLVSLAGGNPLLIRELATGSSVSPTLVEALEARLSRLDQPTIDVLSKLALFGRPAPAHVVGWCDGSDDVGLLVRDDGLVNFSHALISESLVGLLDVNTRTRLHAELAERCADEDAAHHHLLAGDRARAAAVAIRAAESADAGTRAALLALAVEALGCAAEDELRLRACAALIAAHRTARADEIAATVASRDPEIQATAAWYRSQAAWLDGDVQRAERWIDHGCALVAGRGSDAEVHLLVERATQEVRLRVGDPAVVELARNAQQAAESARLDRAKARSVLGLALAHTGQPGWEEHYEASAEIARLEGDDEQECAARYWAASAYGMYGPMRNAIALDDEMLARTEDLGLRRWNHSFLGAIAIHRLGTGNGDDRLIERARRLLVEDPMFRNRAQVELALATGLIDRGDLAGAADVIASGMDIARSDEDRSLLTVSAAELAFATNNLADLVDALSALSRYERGFFGMNAAAESAAIYLSLRADATIEIPAMNTRLLPNLNVVDVERKALDAWRSGDASAAWDAFTSAAAEWSRRSFDRNAARAWYGASEVAERSGRFNQAERARREVDQICAHRVLAPIQTLIAAARAAARSRQVTSSLTQREGEVLRMVAKGHTTIAISQQLAISPTTVEAHIKGARRKLGALTRAQAAALVGGSAS
jgi:DNA-binding CsgD family transcriptional regulator